MTYARYAIYHLPAAAPWSDWATAWLGWDAARGLTCAHPALDLPVARITETPRRYGLHATMKAPFALAPGRTEAELDAAFAAFCAACAPTPIGTLTLSRLGRFLALTPKVRDPALITLAAQLVRALDPFRAPLTEAERIRRAGPGLRGALQDNLDRWGYAHVMDAFRYHITLTGRLDPVLRAAAAQALETHLVPLLPDWHELGALSLMGEDAQGRFHALATHRLTGPVA